MEAEKERSAEKPGTGTVVSENKNKGTGTEGAEKSIEKAVKYIGKAISYRQNFVLARLIDADASVKMALEVFRPEDTIGMIPNGTTGPLIDVLKNATSNIENIYSTVASEALKQYGDSLELSQKGFLLSENSMVIAGQAEKIIKFRKNQKKNVKKPKRLARLDGQMTPSEYSKSALTKVQRNEAARSVKKKLDEEQKKLRSEITSTEKAIKKFGSSDEMAEFESIKSLLEDREFLYRTTSITIAQAGIASRVLNQENMDKLGNVLSVYESVAAKAMENGAFVHSGSKEMQQLIRGYGENLEKLRLMLRGQ